MSANRDRGGAIGKSRDTRPDSRDTSRTRLFLVLALIVAVALQRPLGLLANNLEGGISVDKLALHVALLTVVGLGIFYLLQRFGLDQLVAGFAAAMLCLVALNWESAPVGGPLALALLPVAVVIALRLRESFLPGVIVVAIAVIGVAPMAQFVGSRFARGGIQIGEPDPITAAGSDRVDDVIVVILDEYAGFDTLDQVFDYDASEFVRQLESQGMTVPPTAWSTGASTFVSVSEMLELAPLVPDGVVLSPADEGELYRRMGGENRFVAALRNVGYHYTHVESGWEGTRCGRSVDTCIEAPWIDPTLWELWHPSVIGGVLDAQVTHPFIHAGLNGAERLVGLLGDLPSNGRRDLVIAHILIPHGPFVLTSDCTKRSGDDIAGPSSFAERNRRYVDQITCAESIVQAVVTGAGDDAVLAIVSDHGTVSGGQSDSPIEEWSAQDMAQRFNVFMAYRLPEACSAPDDAVTTLLVGAILSCALELDQIDVPPFFTLALNRPTGPEPVIRLTEAQMRVVRAVYER